MISQVVEDFNLNYTLNSGQVFRWKKIQYWYYGFIGENLVGLRQEGTTLQVKETEQPDPDIESKIRHYLGLDEDIKKIVENLPEDEYLGPLFKRYWGLRVIRQGPWECIASFILSAFNNVKRIQGMTDRLSKNYGISHYFNGTIFYSFPDPEKIAQASEKQLRQLGLGYRAPYLLETARLIDSGKLNLQALNQLEYAQIKEKLLTCPGVGEKVVECILLFAYHHLGAFPVDVWIERLMKRYYFPKRRKISNKNIQQWAKDYFGPYAGYAQQYFYCGRMDLS